MIPGPPEMQPFIRATNKRLDSLDQSLRLLAAKASAPADSSKFAEVDTVGTSPTGNTGVNYVNLTTVMDGPEVSVFATGLVVVTLTAHLTAIWDNTASDATAYGAMVLIVDSEVPADLEGTARYWAHSGFYFRLLAAADQGQNRTVSVTRPVVVSRGYHNFRCGYLYRHVTNGIHLEWSRRSIIVGTA